MNVSKGRFALLVLIMVTIGVQPLMLAAQSSRSAGVKKDQRDQYLSLKQHLPENMRVMKMLDRLTKIQEAPTPEARRALIRALPVDVKYTTDNLGTTVRFTVGNKERMSFLLPGSEPSDPPLSDGGPSVPGRWKLGGDGSCYWDENDEGPDQCQPSGGGGGGETCYGGEPGPCATHEDMIDAIMLGIYSENEAMAMESEIAYYEAEMNAYCSMNYCSDGFGVTAVALGAVACAGWKCAGKLWSATWEVGTWLYGARQYLGRANGAMAAGAGIAVGSLATSTVLLVGGGAMAGLALGYAAHCVVETYLLEPVQHRSPLHGILERRVIIA